MGLSDFSGIEKSLQITFKDTERSGYLETLIRERAQRMEKLHPRIIGCRVVVEVPYRSSEAFKPPICVTVEVEVPGKPLIIGRDEQERHEAKNDTYAMVNRAFEAVQRQLRSDAQMRRGAVKHHEGEGEGEGETGLVVRLFPDEDYGFVEVRGSGDLYFSRKAVVSGDSTISTSAQSWKSRAPPARARLGRRRALCAFSTRGAARNRPTPRPRQRRHVPPGSSCAARAARRTTLCPP